MKMRRQTPKNLDDEVALAMGGDVPTLYEELEAEGVDLFVAKDVEPTDNVMVIIDQDGNIVKDINPDDWEYINIPEAVEGIGKYGSGG